MSGRPHIELLSLNDPQFAEKLMAAIGVKPGDAVEFVTPQFTRTDGMRVPAAPRDFRVLEFLAADALKMLGLQKWGEPDEHGVTLWLFPAEWYEHIPDGFIVTSISGGTKPFIPGVTDDDRRFGALAYGIRSFA